MPNPADTDLDDDLLRLADDGTPLARTVTLTRDWLAEPDTVALDVVYRWEGGELVCEVEGRALHLDTPVRLQPVSIPKPWGREIWYTGIEARGESGVVVADGTLPLSSYLALAPGRLVSGAPLVLLKVLDPSPEPVRGDLYFEVHAQKQEVYVVTRVDPEAWPDGRGAIRYGMNQTLRRRYADDAAFRADYLAAVERYEQVRRRIDDGDLTDADGEPELRAAMERFSELRPLAVGDVVSVPVWLPHALQHGVRVVEFQTPTYERYILSFAQRVVTQSHWDTAEVIDRIRLEPPAPEPPQPMAGGAERIVAFDDFKVWRVALAPGTSFAVPTHPSYALCMVASGNVDLAGLALTAEQAALVPASALRKGSVALCNPGPRPALVLLAAPDL